GIRTRVAAALEALGGALKVVDTINLGPYELLDGDLADLSVWNELAPSVGKLIGTTRTTIDRLLQLFPHSVTTTEPPVPEVDVDAAFDAFEHGEQTLAPARQGLMLHQLVSAAANAQDAQRDIGTNL